MREMPQPLHGRQPGLPECSEAIVSVLRDVNGAQLLPHVRDERAVATRWQAQSVISADLRTVAPHWRDLAEKVTVWP